MIAKEYTRLPGQGTRFDGLRFVAGSSKTCRLWLGKDHLLSIERSWFTEEYRRYYFRDIQAIIIRKTPYRRNWNMVFGTIAGFFGLFTALAPEMVTSVTFGIIAGLAAIGFAINSMMGAICIAHLKTAVQTELLPSLRRLPKANKTLALLKPRIIEAQGALSPEVIAAEAAAENAVRTAAPAGQAYSARGQTDQAAIKPYDSKAHLLMFAALISVGLIALAVIFHNSTGVMTVGALFYAVLCGLAVWAMVQQHQTDLRPSIRRLTWIVAATFVINIILANVVTGVMSASAVRGNQIITQYDVMRNIAAIDPQTTPWFLYLLIYEVVTSIGLGIIGLLLLKIGGARLPKALVVAPAPAVSAQPPLAPSDAP